MLYLAGLDAMSGSSPQLSFHSMLLFALMFSRKTHTLFISCACCLIAITPTMMVMKFKALSSPPSY